VAADRAVSGNIPVGLGYSAKSALRAESDVCSMATGAPSKVVISTSVISTRALAFRPGSPKVNASLIILGESPVRTTATSPSINRVDWESG